MSQNSLKIKKSYLDLPLFKQAFIHKSASSNYNNERLEFLGDAVLEIIVSEYLFHRFEGLDEGRLTQMRAFLVNTQSLASIFTQLVKSRYDIREMSLSLSGPEPAMVR